MTLLSAPSAFIAIDPGHFLVHEESWINFTSLDVYAFSERPEIKKAAMKGLLQFGLEVLPSLNPTFIPNYQQVLETSLATYFGYPNCQLFKNYMQLIQQLLKQLTRSDDTLLLVDERSCRRLMQAAHASEMQVVSFHEPRTLLKWLATQRPKIVITESRYMSTMPDLSGCLVWIDDTWNFGLPPQTDRQDTLLVKQLWLGETALVCAEKPLVQSNTLSSLEVGALQAGFDFFSELEADLHAIEQKGRWLQNQLKKQNLESHLEGALLFVDLRAEQASKLLERLIEQKVFAFTPVPSKNYLCAQSHPYPKRSSLTL